MGSVDRRSSEDTDKVLVTLLSDSSARSLLLGVMVNSIQLAHQFAPASWGLTLKTLMVRLNVGMTEAITVWPRRVGILLAPDHIPSGVDTATLNLSRDYPSANGARLAQLSPNDFVALWSDIRGAHQAAVRAAAVNRNKGYLWKRSHSPGVLKYLEVATGRLVPQPSYYRPDYDPDHGESEVAPQTQPDEVLEGELILALRTHRRREAMLRAAKISSVLSQLGVLTCEVPGCGFDFLRSYGTLGAGFAEVHHLRPLSSRDGNEATSLESLAIVCANCHRMIHVGNECRTLDFVGEALHSRRQLSRSPTGTAAE